MDYLIILLYIINCILKFSVYHISLRQIHLKLQEVYHPKHCNFVCLHPFQLMDSSHLQCQVTSLQSNLLSLLTALSQSQDLMLSSILSFHEMFLLLLPLANLGFCSFQNLFHKILSYNRLFLHKLSSNRIHRCFCHYT